MFGTCKTASQQRTVSSFGLLHTGKPLIGSAEGMEVALEYAAYSDLLKAGFVQLGEE